MIQPRVRRNFKAYTRSRYRRWDAPVPNGERVPRSDIVQRRRAQLSYKKRTRPAFFTVPPPQFNPPYPFEIVRQERRRTYRLRHGVIIAIPYTVVAATPPPYPPQFIRYRRTAGVRARRGVVYFWWPQATQPVAPIHVVEPISGVLVTDGRTSGILVTDGTTTGILVTDGRTTTVIIS
jgi:hypothetical protein